MMKRQIKAGVKTILIWLAYFALAAFALLPILWGIRTSLAPRFDRGLIPSSLTLSHYANLFKRPELMLYFRNSLLIAVCAILVVLPLALLAAYALARFNFKGRQLGSVFLILPMLPAVAILVPLISYMNRLGLYNTLRAVIIVNAVFNLPFAVWMLRNFILANPYEIEEAAQIDGCSSLQLLTRVVLPMLKPGLIAVVIFVFINSWNNYVYAFALVTTPHYRVLPQGILAFLGAWGTNWGGLTAIGTLAMLPPVLLFLLFQNWFVAGLFGYQLK